MVSSPHWSAWLLRLAVAGLSAGCGMGGPGAVAPSIEFTTVPAASEGGPDKLAPIMGRVNGARPGRKSCCMRRAVSACGGFSR